MRILIAMDSFKGNLSSLEVAGIVEKGIRRIYGDAQIEKFAVADGGEGTMDAVCAAAGGSMRRRDVPGPLGETVSARYAVISDGTAIIETAEASGLGLVPKEKRDPLRASTYGTGQLIKAAVDEGCGRIILAAGGSATNDGGTGIARALGVRFLSENGTEVPACGGSLHDISTIDASGAIHAEIVILTDVKNALLGENGASRIFAPQKGATPEMVEALEKNMAHLAGLIKEHTGTDISDIPGMGAAGGIAACLRAFFGAELKSGIEYILDIIQIEDKIRVSDIVITGEGRLDRQTAFGKLPVGIASLAKKHSKPVFAIAGFLGDRYGEVYDHGIDAAVSSVVSPMSLEEAISRSVELIENAAADLFRIIRSSCAL